MDPVAFCPGFAMLFPRPPILQDWPKHWKAKLKKSPGDLSLVTSLVSHLLRYCSWKTVKRRVPKESWWWPEHQWACEASKGPATPGPWNPCSGLTSSEGLAATQQGCRRGSWPSAHLSPTRRSSALSVPDHPISQLLKRLQCAVYQALYPIVSRGANELLGPGSRRLRPSQSLYCVLSTPEPSLALQPLDGLAAGVPPAQPRPPDGGVDSSPLGPPSPLAHTTSHSLDKDSSFEDLEQFLATSERSGRNLGGRPEPQFPEVKEQSLEQLASTVKDIHNAVGEASAHRTAGWWGQLLRLKPMASRILGRRAFSEWLPGQPHL